MFADVRDLLVVLLYEDDFHSEDSAREGRTPLRLSGYRVSRVPHGVRWELTPRLRSRKFHVGSLPEGLIGFHSASAFDLYNSRFRSTACQHSIAHANDDFKVLLPKTRTAATPLRRLVCIME